MSYVYFMLKGVVAETKNNLEGDVASGRLLHHSNLPVRASLSIKKYIAFLFIGKVKNLTTTPSAHSNMKLVAGGNNRSVGLGSLLSVPRLSNLKAVMEMEEGK